MKIDFTNIDYLEKGNPRQKEAYRVLNQHQILEQLQAFNPILVGTIPIEIDIENSDLDIVCYFEQKELFKTQLMELFNQEDGFKIYESDHYQSLAVISQFNIEGFEVEIFGQNIPSHEQNAYRHMLIEHALLIEKGDAFRKQIITLKQEGYKTEPAFAKALGLKGDPYISLLNYTW